MSKLMMAAVLVLPLIGAASLGADPNDKAKFQGKWQVLSIAYEDQKVAGSALKDKQWTFKESTLTPQDNAADLAEFKLDPNAKPATIDIIDRNKSENKGIYKFDGDDLLTICCSVRGKDRPTDFAAGKGKDAMLVVLKRIKE